MRWIWEAKNYPNFEYDLENFQNIMQEISIKQGKLIALNDYYDTKSLHKIKSEILENDAINTSLIEGKILNRESVRSSIRKKLYLKNQNYQKNKDESDHLIDVLIDINTNYDEDLSLEKIFFWHKSLFPNGFSGFEKIKVGEFRGDETMQVVSGIIGDEKVYYQAPPRDQIDEEMKNFILWFNSYPNNLIKVCIAHLWFVIIHPFEDGNGRIARLLSDLVLARIEKSKISRLYSISSAIYNDKKGYYHALEKTTGYLEKIDLLDINYWCAWFLNTLLVSIDDTLEKINFIKEKTKFWDKFKNSNLNSRQIKVLNKILDFGKNNFKGYLNRKKYMSISKTSLATASRDLADLVKIGCVKQVEGSKGRNIKYEIILE